VGKFGGSEQEMFCIQSVDGFLSFFSQETEHMVVQLPDFYLPGPFVYSAKSDSIIISNTAFEIESYRYSVLNAQANQNKKVVPNWVCNIGEQAFHMLYHKNKNTKKNDIVILGD
jgi:hypothetical protein